MALLQELNVKKVSFVSRAANKRKFLLLKSDETQEKKIEPQPEVKKEENPMLKEDIQKAVRLLLKAGMSDEKIVETIKAEHNTNDAETLELQSALSVARSMASSILPEAKPEAKPVEPKVEKKEDESEASEIKKEMDALRKANADLSASIKKDTDDRRKNEIKVWLSDNCSHLPGDAAKMVEDIFKMESTDKEAADRLRESLKASSDLVKNSSILTERGNSFDSFPVPTGDIIMKKVLEAKDTVLKSGNTNMKPSDVVTAAVKSLGSDIYARYRDEHNERAAKRS